jgi:hypothetical protein
MNNNARRDVIISSGLALLVCILMYVCILSYVIVNERNSNNIPGNQWYGPSHDVMRANDITTRSLPYKVVDLNSFFFLDDVYIHYSNPSESSESIFQGLFLSPI